MTFFSMAAVKAANRAAGHHWFEPATLRFFGSRVGGTLYGCRYFISSEFTGFDRCARGYTIRQVNDDGTIDTVGGSTDGLCAYQTRSQAVAAVQRLLRTSHAQAAE
jgi:hypothetical protein